MRTRTQEQWKETSPFHRQAKTLSASLSTSWQCRKWQLLQLINLGITKTYYLLYTKYTSTKIHQGKIDLVVFMRRFLPWCGEKQLYFIRVQTELQVYDKSPSLRTSRFSFVRNKQEDISCLTKKTFLSFFLSWLGNSSKQFCSVY
jgi:hypothetical protein